MLSSFIYRLNAELLSEVRSQVNLQQYVARTSEQIRRKNPTADGPSLRNINMKANGYCEIYNCLVETMC